MLHTVVEVVEIRVASVVVVVVSEDVIRLVVSKQITTVVVRKDIGGVVVSAVSHGVGEDVWVTSSTSIVGKQVWSGTLVSEEVGVGGAAVLPGVIVVASCVGVGILSERVVVVRLLHVVVVVDEHVTSIIVGRVLCEWVVLSVSGEDVIVARVGSSHVVIVCHVSSKWVGGGIGVVGCERVDGVGVGAAASPEYIAALLSVIETDGLTV